MMAFNYLNASSPGRYPYHMPMHLIQQMDLSAMQVPSNTDLSNLNTNVSHLFDHQMPSVDLQLGSSNIPSAKAGIGDFASAHRSAPGLCMLPMTETLSAHRGNYNQHFQHSSQLHSQSDGSPHGLSINKTLDVIDVLCDGKQQFNNIKRTSKESACLSKLQKNKCKRGTKRVENTKANKRVRFMKQGCCSSCQRRCKQKLSQNTREDLFNEFWNLSDDCKRRGFISKHAVKMPMMTCKEGSRRTFSVDWAFTVQGESFSVCKLFFLDTLDISEEMVYSVIKETTFCSIDKSTIRRRAGIKKSVWFETDIDDYSKKRAIECLSVRPRYESKKEKITEMRPGCTDSCRQNCQAKFTHQEKLFIFNSYRNLTNVRKQREFIMKHMRRLERKYTKSNKITRRGCSIEWLLPIKGGSVPVCKTFFLHTVGISEHAAYSIGLQNEIQPVIKHKALRKVQYSSWSFRRNKYLKELIAKGRLKSSLKVNRKTFKHIDTVSYVNDDNLNKTNKAEYLCESNRLKSLSLDNNQPCLIMSSDISLMDSYLQHTGFQPQCLIGSDDIREQYSSSADMEINLTSSVFSQQMLQSRFGNITNNGYISQPSFHAKCEPSYQHGNQMPQSFSVRGKSDLTSKTGHDSLHLHTLKNTSADLFSKTLEKDSKSNKGKRSQSYKQEKLNKIHAKREIQKKSFTKKLKDGCSETCRRKCSQKIHKTAREKLFEEFWQLQSDATRREFILPIVNKVPKKSNTNSESRRGCTIEWTVPYNGELHFVCKKFFLDTFDITENFVKTIHDKIERNAGSMEDMRGKHGKRSAVFVQEENEIEKHIKSVATYKALRCIRCNRDFPRWCLEKKVPLSQFYKDYAEVRKLLGVKPACRTSFTTICAKKFNISHNSPSENLCDECVIASQPTILVPSAPPAFPSASL